MEELKQITHTLNPKENGGEQILFTTYFNHNGDGPSGIYTSHKITLESYGNSASLNLYGTSITPEILREIADDLEKMSKEAEKMVSGLRGSLRKIGRKTTELQRGNGRSSI